MARSATAVATAPERSSSSQQIRERLLSGDAFTVPQLAEEFGVTKGLVTAVLTKFRQQGYEIHVTSMPYRGRRMKHYSVRKKAQRQAEEQAKRTQEQAAKPAEAPPAPELGESLTVTLLALGPNGELRVGLRNGKQTYVCTLDRISN